MNLLDVTIWGVYGTCNTAPTDRRPVHWILAASPLHFKPPISFVRVTFDDSKIPWSRINLRAVFSFNQKCSERYVQVCQNGIESSKIIVYLSANNKSPFSDCICSVKLHYFANVNLFNECIIWIIHINIISISEIGSVVPQTEVISIKDFQWIEFMISVSLFLIQPGHNYLWIINNSGITYCCRFNFNFRISQKEVNLEASIDVAEDNRSMERYRRISTLEVKVQHGCLAIIIGVYTWVPDTEQWKVYSWKEGINN